MKTTQTLLVAVTFATLLTLLPSTSQAVVVLKDGFGDADLDNRNGALQPYDTDMSNSGGGTAGDAYEAIGGNGGIFPASTMVQEVTAVQDSSDVGIRWYPLSGFSSGGDPRANIKIIDDASGKMPETNGLGPKAIAPINKGLALGVESRGRGNGFAGFFPNTVELGPVAGDQVKVSFDFRVWLSSPNFNSSAASGGAALNHILNNRGQVRWGLYQDTDNQLGLTNNTAGFDKGTMTAIPAVWGNDQGDFDGGGPSGPSADGDNGWHVYTPIENSTAAGTFPGPGGADARIREEVNSGVILSGSDGDPVAQPIPFGYVNLDISKVYRLSLTLERFEDPNSLGNLTIKATYDTFDYATSTNFTFEDYEDFGVPATNDLDGGFESDSWDYFAMSLGGSSDTDDIDYIIDDWQLEIFGSNEPTGADYDNDGDVDGRDFLVWQRGNSTNGLTPGDLLAWQQSYGTPLTAAVGAVPEPTSLVLLGLSGVLSLTLRRRNRS